MSTPKLNSVIDIANLFEQVHGYRPAYVAGLPASAPGLPAATVPASIKKTTNMYGEPLYGAADLMGNEVFCPITIEYPGKDGKNVILSLPYAVIGFSRTKTIVSTEMTELDGEVDEVISNRSFDISIKGFFIGQYEQFPDTDIKSLNDVFEYNNTVRLKSAISDIFLYQNDTILIKKFTLPEKPKVIGVRDFAIEAKSSSIFTLYQTAP